jgi:hypothetical protein
MQGIFYSYDGSKLEMDIQEYYKKLNKQKNSTFSKTLENKTLLGLSHDLIINIDDWSKVTSKHSSSRILTNSIEQVDISCLLVLDGLYRSGFAALRLSLEMLTGAIYFSANNLEFEEWLKGGYDLNWSTIMDEENGVLSKRFANAYYPECANIGRGYFTRTKNLYRELSEMVHGNNRTWNFDNPTIAFDQNLIDDYKRKLEEISVILNFQMCVRFLNGLTPEEIPIVESHISDSIGTEEIIRTKIGGTA